MDHLTQEKRLNRSRTTTPFYKSPNGLAETVLHMSSEGSCLMYHFLFSFPRARTAPRQVSECINHDGNHGAVKSLLSWLLASRSLPHTNYSIFELPNDRLVTQNQSVGVELVHLAQC